MAEEDIIWQVRYEIYQYIAKKGVGPMAEELAGLLKLPVDQIKKALDRLDSHYHAIKLSPITHEVLMAWPFSALPSDYPVQSPNGLYWANCAWDALSLPLMLGFDTQIVSSCPDCASPIRLNISQAQLAASKAVVHFAVPPKHFHKDIFYT